jgi:hypothetical protein
LGWETILFGIVTTDVNRARERIQPEVIGDCCQTVEVA